MTRATIPMSTIPHPRQVDERTGLLVAVGALLAGGLIALANISSLPATGEAMTRPAKPYGHALGGEAPRIPVALRAVARAPWQDQFVTSLDATNDRIANDLKLALCRGTLKIRVPGDHYAQEDVPLTQLSFASG